MSRIHIFTAIWFLPTSLFPVLKHRLPTLPSAQQHAPLRASQLDWLSRKYSCTPCPGCDPCPDTHRMSSWPPPSNPTKCTWILCPLKILQRECVRGFKAVAWGGRWPTGVSCKGSQGILVWSRGTAYLTLPCPLLAFSCAIPLLYFNGDLQHKALQSCSIATELQ